MGDPDSVQLARLVDGDDPEAVLAEAGRIFKYWYDDADWVPVRAAADAIIDLFAGSFPGYRACDTGYHDIRHTMAVLLTTARIADGIFIERGSFPASLARDLFIAAACHDVGYIRTVEEEGGTGARFTAVHVERSSAFARAQAPRFGAEGDRVARIIQATGLKGEYDEQAWADEQEKEAGRVLASADLVGQMSDRAYLEKLLFLYYEFKEAGFSGYDTEFDMLRKTMGFYEMTMDRLDGKLGGVRAFVRSHFAMRYGIDKDLCDEAMGRQIDYLRGILDDASSNFRRKLKRMDFELSQPRTA
ncbi:MAG: hypothetical protein CVV51_05980 [Spirochaetae bacterium HGW-Spirochaetae-7]|nr:MAG: hypothetical protein CVV51_05980 [Spirochaetae bacterium HGW-Spirochaetae-7]